MKKVMSLILAITLMLSLSACGGSSAEYGETLKYANNGEFIVNDITLYNQEALIEAGYLAMVSTLSDEEGVIMVDFTMENTGKVDFTVDANKVVVDYNDGVKYEADLLYHNSDGEYEYCQYGYELEKVTSEAENFMVVIPVPLKVIEDTENKLSVEVYYKTFKIR